MEPLPAATVALVRPAASGGVETLLLRRHGRAGFLPSTWVFPGGVVDGDDARVPTVGRGWPGVEPRFAVAAVRECFEEAGVWLGRGAIPGDLRCALQEGRARLADVPGVAVDLDRLHLWSRWITPVEERRRYDTFFFVAAVPADCRIGEGCGETDAIRWVSPREAVAARHLDELFIVPPTFRTLEELAELGGVDDLPRLAAGRDAAPILPRRERYPGATFSVLLPGHPDYPAERPAPGPYRIALVDGRWRSLP